MLLQTALTQTALICSCLATNKIQESAPSARILETIKDIRLFNAMITWNSDISIEDAKYFDIFDNIMNIEKLIDVLNKTDKSIIKYFRENKDEYKLKDIIFTINNKTNDALFDFKDQSFYMDEYICTNCGQIFKENTYLCDRCSCSGGHIINLAQM